MNQNFYNQDDPILSREDAIAILNTPDDKLNDLIARAEGLRRKYKGNRVSIHILTNARSGNCLRIVPTAPNPAVPKRRLINTSGWTRKSSTTTMIL